MPVKITYRGLLGMTSKKSQAELSKAKKNFDKAHKAFESMNLLITTSREPLTLNNIFALLQQALIALKAADDVSKQLAAIKRPTGNLKWVAKRTEATAKSAEDCALALIAHFIQQKLNATPSKKRPSDIEKIIKGVQSFVMQQLEKAKDEFLSTGEVKLNLGRIILGAIEHGEKYLSLNNKDIVSTGTNKRKIY